MLPTARLYSCARCHSQSFICRTCDRGQIYCSRECAIAARTQSQRESRQRHCRTHRARTLNAQRQHRYRLRQRARIDERVTDQGSPAECVRAVSGTSTHKSATETFSPVQTLPGVIVCCCCACECFPSVRLGFLKQGYRRHRVVKPPP
jgi:hypothetical protein